MVTPDSDIYGLINGGSEAHSPPTGLWATGGAVTGQSGPYLATIKTILLLSAAGVLMLSVGYYGKDMLQPDSMKTGARSDLAGIVRTEYVVLILLATIGMLILVSSKDLVPFYLAIELISLSLYVLAAMQAPARLSVNPIKALLADPQTQTQPAEAPSKGLALRTNMQPRAAYSTEAGLRYFLLGALSSGVLLFGCGLIYVVTGFTRFSEIANYTAYSIIRDQPAHAL